MPLCRPVTTRPGPPSLDSHPIQQVFCSSQNSPDSLDDLMSSIVMFVLKKTKRQLSPSTCLPPGTTAGNGGGYWFSLVTTPWHPTSFISPMTGLLSLPPRKDESMPTHCNGGLLSCTFPGATPAYNYRLPATLPPHKPNKGLVSR